MPVNTGMFKGGGRGEPLKSKNYVSHQTRNINSWGKENSSIASSQWVAIPMAPTAPQHSNTSGLRPKFKGWQKKNKLDTLIHSYFKCKTDYYAGEGIESYLPLSLQTKLQKKNENESSSRTGDRNLCRGFLGPLPSPAPPWISSSNGNYRKKFSFTLISHRGEQTMLPEESLAEPPHQKFGPRPRPHQGLCLYPPGHLSFNFKWLMPGISASLGLRTASAWGRYPHPDTRWNCG